MKVVSDAWRQRFGGTARLYGQEALQRFADAHFCVIGIGGVGSWAAEALARTGIGKITLIDMDDVCITNTNRQIHALQGHVGQAKTEVMAQRIHAINPECEVICIDDFITPDNTAELMAAGFDYVIDAIDSVRPKAALIAWCRRNKIPLITTGGAGGQIDPTQIQVSDLAKTIQDPLAAKLRVLYRSPGISAAGRQRMRFAQHGGRAKAHGLCRRLWCGHHGDRHLWFCCSVARAEKIPRARGASVCLMRAGSTLYRLSQRL